MYNIASYQEGFTDGYDEAKEHIKVLLVKFIKEQKEEAPVNPYLQGYNLALMNLKEYIEEYIK